MKLSLDFWMGSHRLSKDVTHFKPMTPKNRSILDKRLLSLKPYESITRKPRSVQDRGFFKAVEYRNLLLYYLRFALQGLLDHKYVKHFELLSAATYKLLKSEISESEINEAGAMLTKFCDDFEVLYGIDAVTMNVHMLRHISSITLQSGPMWCHSMFGFEKNIGVLTASVTNSTDIVETIAFNYCLSLNKNKAADVHTSMLKQKDAMVLETEKTALIEFGITPNEEDKFVLSHSIRMKNQNFKSVNSPITKSIDYCIQMCSGEIGCAIWYIQFEGKIHVLLEEYTIIEHVQHLMKIEKTGRLKVHLCEQIDCKLLFMTFGCFTIAAKEPNFYEVN